jgi:hypothetical protein
LAGDWSRNLAKPDNKDKSTWYWRGDCPPAVTSLLKSFEKQPCVGGGFIWTIDDILNYASNEQQKQDAQPCGTVDMRSYAKAITSGLSACSLDDDGVERSSVFPNKPGRIRT